VRSEPPQTAGALPVHPAAVCFIAICALVLMYVVIVRPGVPDSTTNAASPRRERPARTIQAPGSPEQRNEQRLKDLAIVAEALEAYARKNGGAFLSTNNNLQTLCTYEDLDAGCRLREELDSIPADPAGRNAGYFYQSDGRSFIVAAEWEGDKLPPEAFKCPQASSRTEDRPMVCVGPGGTRDTRP
jgi:hypothetical protein